MLNTSMAVTDMLNSTLSAVTAVIPSEIKQNRLPSVIEGHYVQPSMGVLVALLGEFPGRLMLIAHPDTFANVGQAMYGITLSGEMLESFVGEMGNMVAGNTVSELSARGMSVNISPPTVLVGEIKLAGFRRGIHVPLDLVDVGELNIVLILDERK